MIFDKLIPFLEKKQFTTEKDFSKESVVFQKSENVC